MAFIQQVRNIFENENITSKEFTLSSQKSSSDFSLL